MTGTQRFYDHWNRGVGSSRELLLTCRNNGKTSVINIPIRTPTSRGTRERVSELQVEIDHE